MNKFIRSSLLVFTALLAGLAGLAQGESEKVEMADRLRSNGKIYVVVIVVVTILAGLILYVIRLDKKIGRMEKGK